MARKIIYYCGSLFALMLICVAIWISVPNSVNGKAVEILIFEGNRNQIVYTIVFEYTTEDGLEPYGHYRFYQQSGQSRKEITPVNLLSRKYDDIAPFHGELNDFNNTLNLQLFRDSVLLDSVKVPRPW